MNGCRNGLNNRVRTELCYRLPLGGSTWLQKDRNSELLKEMFIICVFLQFLQPYRCCVHLNGLRLGQWFNCDFTKILIVIYLCLENDETQFTFYLWPVQRSSLRSWLSGSAPPQHREAPPPGRLFHWNTWRYLGCRDPRPRLPSDRPHRGGHYRPSTPPGLELQDTPSLLVINAAGERTVREKEKVRDLQTRGCSSMVSNQKWTLLKWPWIKEKVQKNSNVKPESWESLQSLQKIRCSAATQMLFSWLGWMDRSQLSNSEFEFQMQGRDKVTETAFKCCLQP